MKTIKNKRSYRSKIGRPGSNKHNDNRELPDQTQSSGSQQAARGASGSDDEASGGEEGYSNSDEGNRGDSDAEEDGSGIGSAGMKRKASRSGGSGGKGKQRKV